MSCISDICGHGGNAPPALKKKKKTKKKLGNTKVKNLWADSTGFR